MTPACRKCGSSALRATSSQQFRTMKGKRRQVADVVCLVCGHQWWSVHPAIRKQAREADKARQDRIIVGKKSRPDVFDRT
jgi:RNase P subunit RPR2